MKVPTSRSRLYKGTEILSRGNARFTSAFVPFWFRTVRERPDRPIIRSAHRHNTLSGSQKLLPIRNHWELGPQLFKYTLPASDTALPMTPSLQ